MKIKHLILSKGTSYRFLILYLAVYSPSVKGSEKKIQFLLLKMDIVLKMVERFILCIASRDYKKQSVGYQFISLILQAFIQALLPTAIFPKDSVFY